MLPFRVRVLYPKGLGKHTVVTEKQKYINAKVMAKDLYADDTLVLIKHFQLVRSLICCELDHRGATE